MGNQLAVIETQFKPLLPRMEAAIPPNSNLPVKRVMESVLIAHENNDKLFECDAISRQRSVFTACVTGLAVDGMTGQGFLVPYSNRGSSMICQFQTGFKGYSTIAARSRYILGGDVIYQGEKARIRVGTGGFVEVEVDLSKRNANNKIVGAFATLESNFAPPLVVAMSLDQILAIQAISKAKYDGAPWKVHFNEMAIKTAKKRLGKSCPVDILQLAASLDDAADQGKTAFIRPEDRALIIDAEVAPVTPFQPQPAEEFTLDRDEERTDFILIDATGKEHDVKTPDAFVRNTDRALAAMTARKQVMDFQDRHRSILRKIEVRHPELVADVRGKAIDRLNDLPA